MPALVFLAALIAVAAPVRSPDAARVSARISCASAYFAIAIVVVNDGYLSGVQICVEGAVPLRPVLVTATRGSGAPPIVRPRNAGSTVAQLFELMATKE